MYSQHRAQVFKRKYLAGLQTNTLEMHSIIISLQKRKIQAGEQSHKGFQMFCIKHEAVFCMTVCAAGS